MDVLKFERLPTEILLLLFEEFINGVDMIIAFAGQQNQHIDNIIGQCNRHSFDFVHCHRHVFRACLIRLPLYIGKIARLALSDHQASGQVSSFLMSYPLLNALQPLNKLYLHFDALATSWTSIQVALLSLPNTQITDLTIKVTNSRLLNTLEPSVLAVPPEQNHRLANLERFTFIGWVPSIYWEFIQSIALNVENLTHLTLQKNMWNLAALGGDYRRLEYLNIRLNSIRSHSPLNNPDFTSDQNASFPVLHTFIVRFPGDHPMSITELHNRLSTMPALRHLDITAHQRLLSAREWEQFLTTQLLLLSYFRLRTTMNRLGREDLWELLDSFEQPFWVNLPYFYFIVTKHHSLNRIRSLEHLQLGETTDDRNDPVVQWWAVPFRARQDPVPMSDTTTFGLSEQIMSLSSYYYFNNVRRLVMFSLDDDRQQWLSEHINLAGVKCLDLANLAVNPAMIHSLLRMLPQIDSLEITSDQLRRYSGLFAAMVPSVKSLTIVNGNVTDEVVRTISQVFPQLENLTLREGIIRSPLTFHNQLPALRSLTMEALRGRCSMIDLACVFPLISPFTLQQLHFMLREDWYSIALWIDLTVPCTISELNGQLRSSPTLSASGFDNASVQPMELELMAFD